MDDYLVHHGILGMKWGVRRYQNEDGSLTKAGERHFRVLQAKADKKDSKWVKKNEQKIYSKTYKASKGELAQRMANELKGIPVYNADKHISSTYANAFNKILAETMNKNVGDVTAPSGKIVQYVAKRGSLGVYTALADRGYDMSQVKNGVWSNGRIGYKSTKVDVDRG